MRERIDKWKVAHNDGEDPDEDEEATGDQITALKHILEQGCTPFVDFAVWRPHADNFEAERVMTAYYPTGPV